MHDALFQSHVRVTLIHVRRNRKPWRLHGYTLFEAIAEQIENSIAGTRENLQYDKDESDHYLQAIDALEELPDLSALVNLGELLLWGNHLATLPASLAGCTALRKINVYRNKLTAFPAVLSELPKLVELQLGQNMIATVGDACRHGGFGRGCPGATDPVRVPLR
jgi:hypothetical protein